MNEYDELIERNEYDSLLDDQSSVLKASAYSVKDKEPDRQAKVIQLSERTGIPVSVVDRQFDKINKQIELENDYDQIIKDSPTVAKWFSDPNNASVSKDDVKNLSVIEKVWKNTTPLGWLMLSDQGKGLRESLSRIPQTITRSLLTDPAIEITGDKARPRYLPSGLTDTGFTDITGEFRDVGIPDRYAPAPESFAKDLNTIMSGINESLKIDERESFELLPDNIKQERTTPGVNTAKILDNLAQAPAYMVSLFMPGKLAAKAIPVLSNAQKAVIAGAASNSAVIGSQTYNDAYQAAYDSYIDLGVSTEEAKFKAEGQARKAADTMRVIAALTGSIGEGSALATQGIKGIPKTMFMGAVSEVPEELSQNALTKAAAGETLTQDEVIEITALSALLGGTISGGMAGLNVMVESKNNKGLQADNAKVNLDQLAQSAQASKLAQRSPEKFKELVDEIGQTSGQEAVWIPVDELTTYYQSQNIDPATEVSKLTGDSALYQEALNTGSDIKIPLSSFAADIAVNHYDGLRDHIRTDPDGFTPSEAKEYAATGEQLEDVSEPTDTSPQVYDSILSQLIDAGIEKKAAQKQAKLYQNVFRSLGERSGLDPVELYNRYGLSVSRVDLPTEERRTDNKLREILDKVSPEEREVLLTSEVIPALPKKLAFEMHMRDNPDDRVLFFDFDDFKAINDKLGEDETDASILVPAGEIIRAVATEAGIRAYHRSGDEFLGAGATDEQLTKFAELLRERLKSAKFIATLPDGTERTFEGIGFSYGIGQDEKTSRRLSKEDKARRKAAGLRTGARDAPGVAGQTPAGDQIPGGISETTLNQAPSDEGVSGSDQTKTKAFRDWFGEEGIRDDDGNPEVFYHAGDPDFSEINPEIGRFGGIFILPKEHANYRDTVYPLYMKGPMAETSDIKEYFFETDEKEIIDLIKEVDSTLADITTSDIEVIEQAVVNENTMDGFSELVGLPEGDDYALMQKLRGAIAKKMGFTSVRMEDEFGGDATLVLEPTAIKSAIGNRGTFDPTNPNILYQKVFHGTPYKFDRFSLDAIGTGEGAQAYGYGLYFAGKKEVAEYYRESVGTKESVKIGTIDDSFFDDFDTPIGDLKSEAARLMDSELLKPGYLKSLADKETFLGRLSQAILDGKITRDKGNIIQVEIPEDSDLLDWDKPLKDQPEGVLKKAEKALRDNGYGELVDAAKTYDAGDTKALKNAGFNIFDYPGAFGGLYDAVAAREGKKKASMIFNKSGIPGLRYLDANSRDDGDGTYNYVIWDENAVTVEAVNDELRQAEGLFQPPPDGGYISPRGRIRFNEGRTQFNIELMKNADMSTFLHESAHFYFEVIQDLVRRGEADEGLQNDLKTLLEWSGNKGEDITVDQHEQIARGFEAYLMEGKSPSEELNSVFARFRSWLVQVYKSLKSLNVDLSDDVRKVFDRLVATSDEIAAAEKMQDYKIIFDNPVLAKVAREAREAAETKLTNQAIREITREQKKTWKENRKRMREIVEQEINELPEYVALSFFSRGTLPDGSPLPEGTEAGKLSKQALLQIHDNEWLVRNLFPKKVYTNDGGLDPDIMAPVFGFNSGDELVQAMSNARPRKEAIELETDRRMKQEYGDMMTDGTIKEKAMEAVHNEKREQLLLAELRAIRQKQNEAKSFLKEAERERTEARKEGESILPSQKEMRFIKASAENVISRKKIRDLNPNVYRVAEAKASRLAFNAAAKGDYETAFNEKLKQIRNHALYRAAVKAKKDSESTLKYFQKFQKKTLRQRLGKVGKLEQVDMLLGRYDLRKVSNKKIDADKAKLDLLQAINGGFISAPKSFTDSLRGADKINFREETIEAVMGLRDILRQMETEARSEYEVLVNNERMDLDQRANEMADTVLTTNKSVMPIYGELSAEEKMKEFGKSLLNAWLRTPSLARLLDGDQRGAWTRNIIEPVRKAMVEKLEPMKKQANDDLAKLYSDHYTKKELVSNGLRKLIPGINQSLTRWDLISLALNWGNLENRQAVLDSTVNEKQPYTEEGVLRAFQELDTRDFKFIQAVWDYVDSYWPEIKEAQTRRKGIAPPKVEAEPFTVRSKDGEVTLKGGYYPLKYEGRLDARSRQDEMDDAFEKMRVGVLSSTQTKYGHNQERVGSGKKPIKLSMGVLHNHINNVVMDLALGDAVIYTDKVLNRPQVKQSLIDTGNLDALESFKLWLKDVAVGEMSPRSGGEQVARFVRLGFAKSKVGANMVTAALQIAGLPQTMVVVGKKWFAKGAFEYSKSPRQAIKQVMSQSKLMEVRYELNSYNKEVQGVYEAFQGGRPSHSQNAFVRTVITMAKATQVPLKLLNVFFYLMKKAQLQVDTITWLSGYEKAKSKGLNHNESIAYADGVVENAQTSGMWNDRSSVERGTLSAVTRQNEYVKLLTTLGSYMIAKGNIAYGQFKGTDFKKPAEALGFMVDVLALFSAEAVLAAAIRGQWPEDDEEWWWWATKKASVGGVESALSTIPIVREIPSAVKGFGVGGPIGGTVTDIGRAFNQTAQAEVDAALMKSYMNLIGTATGLPSSQINRVVDAYWRESEGQDVPIYEYFIGRTGNR